MRQIRAVLPGLVRDGHGKGKVSDFVPMDNVAWKLEMTEVEERALDRRALYEIVIQLQATHEH